MKNRHSDSNIRVRFAPSPTGVLHIGSARTALFNYLFARHTGGTFILRVEDTDRSRSTVESENNIIEGLKWLGLGWDEGPDAGGPFGHYRQMERLDIYKQYAQKLLAENKAYHCFCKPEELEKEREAQMKEGIAPRYSGKCKNKSKDETKKLIAQNTPHVIRFAIEPKKIIVNDLIRGRVEFDASLFGDFVMVKSDGVPIFIFSNVVDDIEMKISHVIRGEDHLSNTPKQILVYEALGEAPPQFAHIPMILGPDKSKLSKRHGSTSIDEYKNQGFLADAIVNFISLLGWNPGTDQEIFMREDLIKQFSLERIQKSGAVFNIEKLKWLNGNYIRNLKIDRLAELCIPYLQEASLMVLAPSERELARLEKIILLEQSRIQTISEISGHIDYFFKEPQIDQKILIPKKGNAETTKKALDASAGFIKTIEDADFEANKLKDIWYKFCEQNNFKPIEVLWPLRAAFTGKEASAGAFEIMEILGKEKCAERINRAISVL